MSDDGFDEDGIESALARLEAATYDRACDTEGASHVPSWWKSNLARFNGTDPYAWAERVWQDASSRRCPN